MAIGKDTALRLMLVDDQVNEAEAIVSSLRNAGIAVRPLRAESLDELAQILSQQPVDMVLAEYASTQMPFAEVAAVVMGCGRDVPLLAVLDGITDEILDSVQAQGAQTVALRGRPQQFLKNVRTEWHDLDARRSQRHLEAQMRETERRCDMLIDSSREPIAYIHEGMHIRANQAYLEMFGYETFEDIEGMSLLDFIAPKDVEEFKALLKRLSKGEPPPPRHELTARDIDGTDFPAIMEFTAAQYEGEACQQVIFRRQATEQDPELARQVEELKQRDPATGLLNRPTFLGLLDGAVAEAAGQGAAHGLLLIEPDHYAQLLDVIGLDAADDLMAAMGQRLDSVANDAITARFGEHQLALLVRGSDYRATSDLAERVREAFAGHVLEVGDNTLNATVSIGGVQIGEKIASTSQVLAKATQGVVSAVGVGGNRVQLFDPGAVDRAEQERIAAWVARIQGALDSEGFRLDFQPVIALQGDGSETYEMFLRLHGSDGVPVEASTYLPIAEEHDLLRPIDRWAVSRAVALVGERLRAGKRTSLLLSVSQEALLDSSMPAFIADQLAAAGVPGEQLILAVPEAKVFTNLHAAQEFAGALAGFGSRMALEHFGAGLNSLQTLQHFEPALLKIDPQFMDDLSKSADSQARVREIAQQAGQRGIRTVAERVQDASSMTLLFSAGVDYVQGDFLAPAGPDMTYDFS
ncbi:MAG TPA: EAL domain-containing protein [Thermomonas sp.]|jgi:diguanylate cyclase (GGDEF)-like protein/PAS domain S-box-containing protein|uniref:EAL domain-containing protein n=1 Tax=Thermomonas sp. TaxID=1971895 RepID=UPI002CFA4146|nr:EAL domain-containing protein [Thermomonas sp.]HPM55533.1 EAL domain-containing protein [Thermomonas sp.]HPW12689.1 EAL domain-containing protein [Thermomonas sp.]